MSKRQLFALAGLHLLDTEDRNKIKILKGSKEVSGIGNKSKYYRCAVDSKPKSDLM